MSKTTDIVCVLDRSGSMYGSERDVIGGFNAFIEDQKKVKGKVRVTLVLFDHEYELVYNRIKLKNVPVLTELEYFPRGSTSLNDAIGTTIANLKKGAKGIFLIQTDGMENTSREYTNDSVKELVAKKENKGWEFVYLGAEIDAFSEGNSRGFGNTVTYSKSAESTNDMYGAVSVMSFATRTAIQEDSVPDIMASVNKDKLQVSEKAKANV